MRFQNCNTTTSSYPLESKILISVSLIYCIVYKVVHAVAVFNYHRVPEQLVNLITVKILVSVWHRDRYQLCMKAQI